MTDTGYEDHIRNNGFDCYEIKEGKGGGISRD